MLLLSSFSFSQNKDYEYSNGFYSADLKVAYNNVDMNDNIKIESKLGYDSKKEKYYLLLGMEDSKGWLFDVIKTEFTIDIELDAETIKYKLDAEHIATDLSVICYDVPKDDLLKYNDSKKVVANVYLLKGDEDKEKSKEIFLKIDLKPEMTGVYLDFYNFSLKDNEKK
jgi:hypothetical protein